MPIFEKNQNTATLNEVLIDVPFEKSYISKPTHYVPQANQKEGTCWYYVLNHLRIRYGKDLPITHPGRKIEAILSNYRKKTSENDKENAKLISMFQSLQYEYGEVPIDKKIVQKKLSYIQENANFLITDIAIYQNFLAQHSQQFFSDFVEDSIAETTIATCRKTLEDLGIDPDPAFENYLLNHADENQDLSTIYQLLVYQAAIEKYHLLPSSWQPKNGINNLIDELRKNGALAASGAFDPDSYASKSQLIAVDFSKRPLFGWENENCLDDIVQGHEILIIGAKKEGEKEEVYFLDPQDLSKVHKISYDSLIARISNVNGLNKTDSGPFLFHADEAWLKQEKKSYASLFKNDRDMKEVTEKMEMLGLKGKKGK